MEKNINIEASKILDEFENPVLNKSNESNNYDRENFIKLCVETGNLLEALNTALINITKSLIKEG